MKKYNKPILELEKLVINDVIAASGDGTFGNFNSNENDLVKKFGDLFGSN